MLMPFLHLVGPPKPSFTRMHSFPVLMPSCCFKLAATGPGQSKMERGYCSQLSDVCGADRLP